MYEQNEPAHLTQPGTRRRPTPLLFRRYPILFPLLLLMCAVVTGYAVVAGEDIFPGLTLIGVSSKPLCLSIALIAGISGILTSIIGTIEYIDRQSIKVALFPEPKEQKPC